MNVSSSVILPCTFHLQYDDLILNITWSFNGSIISSSNQTESDFPVSGNGFKGVSQLKLYNVTPHNQGVYECHVKTNLTSQLSNVTLNILGKFQSLHIVVRMTFYELLTNCFFIYIRKCSFNHLVQLYHLYIYSYIQFIR